MRRNVYDPRRRDEWQLQGNGEHSKLSRNVQKPPEQGLIWTAIALYDFDPRQRDELPLKAGTEVIVESKHDRDEWWEGTCRGQRGCFPSNFVKVVGTIRTRRSQYAGDATGSYHDTKSSNSRDVYSAYRDDRDYQHVPRQMPLLHADSFRGPPERSTSHSGSTRNSSSYLEHDGNPEHIRDSRRRIQGKALRDSRGEMSNDLRRRGNSATISSHQPASDESVHYSRTQQRYAGHSGRNIERNRVPRVDESRYLGNSRHDIKRDRVPRVDKSYGVRESRRNNPLDYRREDSHRTHDRQSLPKGGSSTRNENRKRSRVLTQNTRDFPQTRNQLPATRPRSLEIQNPSSLPRDFRNAYDRRAKGQISEKPVVVSVTNLPLYYTTDMIFNLVSGYGDVHKIKLLGPKLSECLIQLNGERFAENVLKCLQHCPFFGKVLRLRRSKLNNVSIQGTLSKRIECDYTKSRKRLMWLHQRKYGKAPPTRVLFVYNVPPECDMEKMVRKFEDFQPRAIHYPPRSRLVYVIFATVEKAVNALSKTHNSNFEGDRAFDWISISFSNRKVETLTGLLSWRECLVQAERIASKFNRVRQTNIGKRDLRTQEVSNDIQRPTESRYRKRSIESKENRKQQSPEKARKRSRNDDQNFSSNRKQSRRISTSRSREVSNRSSSLVKSSSNLKSDGKKYSNPHGISTAIDNQGTLENSLQDKLTDEKLDSLPDLEVDDNKLESDSEIASRKNSRKKMEHKKRVDRKENTNETNKRENGEKSSLGNEKGDEFEEREDEDIMAAVEKDEQYLDLSALSDGLSEEDLPILEELDDDEDIDSIVDEIMVKEEPKE